MKVVERKFRSAKFGTIDNDPIGRPLILLKPGQDAEERLDSIIHEWLHHRCPDWNEAKVLAAADELSDVLWQDGWRRKRNRK